jgi:hypothetical protein
VFLGFPDVAVAGAGGSGTAPVKDYRTFVSGVTPEHLVNASNLREAQEVCVAPC